MKHRSISLRLLCALLAVLLLAGCGAAPETPTETTEATEPAPTTPPNGNPDDVTCLGSYTVSGYDTAASRDMVVATIGDAELTNGQLQVYYWLEVATYRQSDAEVEPDYGQSLDTQPCPIDDSVASWQQYFLKAALNTWHTHQSLALMAGEEGVPTEEEYKPDVEKHTEYMTDKPAYQYHRAHFDSYQPNSQHQAYLDALPETINALAADSGFADSAALAAAIAGDGANAADLEHYAQTANYAYMYFTEMGYQFEPTAEEVEAFYAANKDSLPAADGEKSVDIRHILLIPDGAEIAADGTVTASEDAWNACQIKAQNVMSDWKEAVRKTRYAQHAIYDPAEARFSEAAKNKSQDEGSRAKGGLYANLRQGQLAEALDSWCFDPVRQHGDTQIIRSECGYHVVFFSAATESWYAAAEDGLITQMGQELAETARKSYPITVKYADIKLGQAADNGSFITSSDLLYPDVAHERFPEMPLYLQQDYPDAPYGNYKVSTHGCGITTLSMVASYLADEELTPVDLGARYGYYCGVRGTEICIFDDTPAEMGFHLMKRGTGYQEIQNAIENGQVVVALQWAGYWTSGGHYIAVVGKNEDGRYVVRDSNLLNYKRITAHEQDSHTWGSISGAAQYFWIYEPKVVRIPACVRCSEDLNAGAPGVLFREDYTCPKCTEAMTRRDTYLTALAG